MEALIALPGWTFAALASLAYILIALLATFVVAYGTYSLIKCLISKVRGKSEFWTCFSGCKPVGT